MLLQECLSVCSAAPMGGTLDVRAQTEVQSVMIFKECFLFPIKDSSRAQAYPAML